MDTVLLEFETKHDPETNAARDGEPRPRKLRIEFPPVKTSDCGYPIPMWHKAPRRKCGYRTATAGLARDGDPPFWRAISGGCDVARAELVTAGGTHNGCRNTHMRRQVLALIKKHTERKRLCQLN